MCPLTCCLAQTQAHAFIAEQQPGAALGVWDATGPAGAAGGPLPPAPLGPYSGWVVAAAVLLASRMGRLTAQEARMDVRKLQPYAQPNAIPLGPLPQFERERSRAMGKELLAARDRWRAAEAERAAAEDSRRVEEAAARAREEQRRQRELHQRYQEAAAKEAERLRAEREGQRKAYESQQAKLDAEMAARAEQERIVIEQQRAAARAAEDQKRREEEARKRQQQEERRQREERERQEREEAIRVKLEERQRLEREKKRFAMRLEGSLMVERPPKDMVLPGPLQTRASVRLSASCTTLLGGPAAPPPVDFASLAEASQGLPTVAAEACRLAADGYCSAMRLQSMSGEGVLQWIDDTELQHWACTAAARAAVGAVACRTELGVLPADHPQRSDAQLRRVVAAVEDGDSQAAGSLLSDIVAGEVERFQADLPACAPLSPPTTALMGTALLLSHLITRALAERPSATSDAPAWFETTASLARSSLQAAAAGAAKDSLQLPAAIVAAVLGSNNPVAEELERLAAANLSAEAKKAQEERERRKAAELAAKLLAEEWPDAAETKAARLAEREAKTPVPERCWALRNVAGQLSMGGPGERARARSLLEQAVLLKQQYAGAADHPGVLPELLPLANLLSAEPEWQRDAAGVAGLAMSCLANIAAAYLRRGDAVSAAVLLEASLRTFEEVAGVRSTAVKAAMRAADAALDGLSPEQRAVVADSRRGGEAVVRRVVAALTDELAAYQQGSLLTKVQRWDADGVALIGPLH
ncbi:Reticulocyte-binding protein 2 a [Chlorella vulgaris]